MAELITRASSINRALDQIGDKWCLLIIQEVLWGINTFNEMMEAMGVSRGVLSNRLKWMQEIDCLRRETDDAGRKPTYHLTSKSIDLYDCALMANRWERNWFDNPQLDTVELVHLKCGKVFQPEMQCGSCREQVVFGEVTYKPGPGATRDVREKKVRRRSSIDSSEIPSKRALYRNLINLVGDRWTANVIALAYHGITRFEEFHRELPVATNILADRLRLLVEQGVFVQVEYQQRPMRQEYQLTDKGRDLFPWFLALLQWGDKWCDAKAGGAPMLVNHVNCGKRVRARVCCNECGEHLIAHQVEFTLNGQVM
ncbi:transcriptional regulator [Halioglobus maricola]|uniref:Transcriptional regulator n=1 Tax=Halioglobus maricola TaxID=2601894 RepID=A0A5P9NME6_9GAMM|nr:winged helix-turn-helix transcriptional regulator [Halioglobus maricola]QFU76799.1 transcriptional regulator [Halioglobus maricola]